MGRAGSRLAQIVLAWAVLGCGSPGSEESTADGTGVTEGPADAPVFTHKMMRQTGENMFAALGYECPQCTFEQWLAIEPPDGWSKGPAQVLLADSGEMRSTPSIEGVPDTMDFIEEVPGNEYQLIVRNLEGRIVGSTQGGFVVEAKVMRDNMLRFEVGRRVHELTDPDGHVFVLFAHEVDPHDVVVPDAQDPELLGDFSPPDGYVYASRVLQEALVLDTTGTATVLAFRGSLTTTWERR